MVWWPVVWNRAFVPPNSHRESCVMRAWVVFPSIVLLWSPTGFHANHDVCKSLQRRAKSPFCIFSPVHEASFIFSLNYFKVCFPYMCLLFQCSLFPPPSIFINSSASFLSSITRSYDLKHMENKTRSTGMLNPQPKALPPSPGEREFGGGITFGSSEGFPWFSRGSGTQWG